MKTREDLPEKMTGKTENGRNGRCKGPEAECVGLCEEQPQGHKGDGAGEKTGERGRQGPDHTGP